MPTTHYATLEQFLNAIDNYLELVKPGDRVEINKKVVLICPKDLRFLDKCVELVDDLPVGIDSLIENED